MTYARTSMLYSERSERAICYRANAVNELSALSYRVSGLFVTHLMSVPTHAVRLIVNPVSGKGRGAKVAEQASRLLRERGFANEILSSRAPAEPVELARAAVRDHCSLVVGVGGDGLLSQVASELVGS